MRAATGEARVGPVEEGKLTSTQRPSGRFTEATWREGNVLNIGPQDRHESIEEAIGAEADGMPYQRLTGVRITFPRPRLELRPAAGRNGQPI